MYGCPPTPSIVRSRNPGFPHRGFFVSATLAGHLSRVGLKLRLQRVNGIVRSASGPGQ